MEAMDLTNLRLPDESISLIYCSHVLEHIPDDRAAMAEMRRVLIPGGQAVVIVPTGSSGVTEEDPLVTDPRERTRRFGQFDHVRRYGRDIVQRLEAAGFVVERFEDATIARDLVERHGLGVPMALREVFLCRAR
jgi:ubiquinone/menaquinone biosynthesis C-methylase UbiE